MSVPPGRHLLCSLHRNLALVTVIRANENLDPSATKHSNGRVHAASRRHISMNQMYQVLRQTYRITSLTNIFDVSHDRSDDVEVGFLQG